MIDMIGAITGTAVYAVLVGVFSLTLAADGGLSAPFAPVAGAGDFLVGALAIPLAAMAAAGAGAPLAWLGVWNALGALDLIVAVSLGVLSAPGTPFRVFPRPNPSQAGRRSCRL